MNMFSSSKGRGWYMSIFVITHKYVEGAPVLDPSYKWLYVGGYRVEDHCKGYLYDNIGQDNISIKNANFCELTGLYWIWHNCNENIKGLVHYRRFFTKNVWSESEKFFYTGQEMDEMLKKYDMIVGDRRYFAYGNIANHYARLHVGDDLECVRMAIHRLFDGEYSEAFDIAFSKNYLFPYNMFVAPKEIFDSYAEWLFRVLFELERDIDFKKYNDYQARVFGFLSERLLNVWIIKNNIAFKELPIIQIGTRVRYKIRTELEKTFKMPLDFLAKIDKMVEKL